MPGEQTQTRAAVGKMRAAAADRVLGEWIRSGAFRLQRSGQTTKGARGLCLLMEHKDVFSQEETLLAFCDAHAAGLLAAVSGPAGVRGPIMYSHSSCTS